MSKPSRALLLAVCGALLFVPAREGRGEELSPAAFVPVSPLDQLLVRGLQQRGLTPAPRCSDEVFVRRVYLDLIGTIPTAGEARKFIASRVPSKRAELIDALMARPEFADYWTLKWCDALRVKAEFPINLWPNGVQAYARWIHEAMTTNMPYDDFARAMLTSNGSNFRVAPVNFYRAVQGEEPEALAAAVALTFMGTRLEKWATSEQANLATFFSRVAFKGTAEWKETIVFPDPSPQAALPVTFPDGRRVVLAGEADPRVAFTDWLVAPENPWFARAVVNRVWFWFFGAGFSDAPDDIRADNPPVHPEMLALLEEVLVSNEYDLRHLMRVILNSSTYQQRSVGAAMTEAGDRLFARYPTRHLDAEVLLDALGSICGLNERYVSAIPEPFTFIPPEHRSITLTDGSISSPFLKMFGRPARDTGQLQERSREPTREQRLMLINSSRIQGAISRGAAPLKKRSDIKEKLEWLYLTVLARFPSAAEEQLARQYLKKKSGKQAYQEWLWALVNSKEFLYQH